MVDWVHLIEQNSYDTLEIALKIEQIFHSAKIDVDNLVVALKPSFVFPLTDFERVKMINTHQSLVSAVAGILVKIGAKMVLIMESETAFVSRYCFKIVKLRQFLSIWPKAIQKKIKFVYLDECLKQGCTPENPVLPNVQFQYPKICHEVDILITMPKLKVNTFANITLSVKNGMGFISRKERLQYHGEHLHEMIADLFTIRPPDYCITDAIIAGEGQGPMAAKPYPTNLLLFGNNALAVDSVCCELMGYNPTEIKHLCYLSERGYGSLNLQDYEIHNSHLIAIHRHTFTRPQKNLLALGIRHPKLHIYQGEINESGAGAFLQMIFDLYEDEKIWDEIDEDIYLIYGRNVNVPTAILHDPQRKTKNTIIFGDGAKKYARYGVFWGNDGNEAPDYADFMLNMKKKTNLPPLSIEKKINLWKGFTTLIQFILANKNKTLRNYVK